MEPIFVTPHGTRWAVKESPDATPIAEFDTCELAELDARARARESGQDVVVVRESDDAQLGRVDEPDVEDARRPTDTPDAGIHERTGGAAANSEMPREPQAGL